MKVGILAGGRGSRLAEQSDIRPKPMVEIGGRPILWHIMRHYVHHGFRDFYIALGYKGEHIKKYFVDYCNLHGDLSVDLETGKIRAQGGNRPGWRVNLIETGCSTNTGGRIKRLAPHLGGQTFMITWGDGVSDVNIQNLVAFHKKHGKIATLTAVRPPPRYGHLELDGDQIVAFSEKCQLKEGLINGAFFVLEPKVFDYIAGDDTAFEREPLEALAREGQLMAFKHTSFWRCMDTLREKRILEEMWASGAAPWRTWSQ